jgi:hypothetical protein
MHIYFTFKYIFILHSNTYLFYIQMHIYFTFKYIFILHSNTYLFYIQIHIYFTFKYICKCTLWVICLSAVPANDTDWWALHAQLNSTAATLKLCNQPGLPDFSWCKFSKTVKNILNDYLQAMPNDYKMYQMTKKYTKWLKNTKLPQNIPTSSVSRSSKIYKNWQSWHWNIQSGNPAINGFGIRRQLFW